MKKALIAIIILLLLGVGGYYYLNSKNLVPKSPVNMIGSGTTASGGIFGSIKDALSKSLSLECSFKDEQGKQTTVYIKAGAVRTTFDNSKDTTQPNNVIMKDKKIYMWNDVSKTGLTYTLEEPKNISPVPSVNVPTGAPEKNSGNSQQDSILATIDKFKNSCKPGAVADSYFTVPADVKFQDMSALQKEMMKGLPQAPPSGANSADYQQYVQNMMKQAGQNAGQ